MKSSVTKNYGCKRARHRGLVANGTQSSQSRLFCAGLKMALTVDEALEKVGTFGRFQILLLLFSNCLRWVWSGWPILVMTFLSAEPPWRCVANSTVCTLSGVINIGDDDYDKRCNMSRTEWEFSRDFTSVVTEVRCRRGCWLHTRLTWLPSSETRDRSWVGRETAAEERGEGRCGGVGEGGGRKEEIRSPS